MFTLVIGFLAGLATGQAETHLSKALEALSLEKMPLETGERKLLAFAVLLMIAGALDAMSGTGSPVILAIGGFLGVFGKRLIDTFMNRDRSED